MIASILVEVDNPFLVLEEVVALRQHVLGLVTAKGREQAPAVAAFRDIFKSFRSDTVLA